jgi:hypothetical protein
MTTIIIASKSNSVHLAECQVLAEYLKANCPSFDYEVVMKHKNEWPSFAVSLKNSYAFHKLCCPLIFTVEGQLIGDTVDFHEFAKSRYGKEYSVNKDLLTKRAKENIK